MRVLLDENIDRLLKGLFDPDFEVLTAEERGWQGRAMSLMYRPNLWRGRNDRLDETLQFDKRGRMPRTCDQALGRLI
jgi:hypothetical protein